MKDFNKNLTDQFKDFEIKHPDVPNHMKHLYADYVELVALFSSRNFVTSTDILDRLKDEGAIKSNDKLRDKDSAMDNDRNEVWVDEIFQILEQRSITYGTKYPFDFTHNKIVLTEKLTSKNEVYLFLLLAANLSLFSSVKSSLTSDFEVVAYEALRTYLPDQALVKQFGKQSEYKGIAKEKIKLLAADMKTPINEAELDNVSDLNKMERGLDVVGWIPFDDLCPNFFTILGQCACGKEWPSKQHDTKRFQNYFKFDKTKPIHAMFIPYALVGARMGIAFYNSDEVEDGTMVFERKRITELFNDSDVFSELESKQIVDRCLATHEDIV